MSFVIPLAQKILSTVKITVKMFFDFLENMLKSIVTQPFRGQSNLKVFHVKRKA